MENCCKICEQQAFMTTNTSQDVGRSGLRHCNSNKKSEFITLHRPLSSSMTTVKPSKNRFMSPTVCPEQSNTRTVSFMSYMVESYFQGEQISFCTLVAISEKRILWIILGASVCIAKCSDLVACVRKIFPIHTVFFFLCMQNNPDIHILAENWQVIYSQFGLAIHQNDHQARRRFVEWAQNEIAVVNDFHKRILFSDEAHFWLNGYVNKRNCRIWSEVNPQVYVKTPLHPEKLTVWCTLWAGGIIGPNFFKNDEGHNVTVNGDRYRAMITNFFISELNNHDVQELWFQQEGATFHTARATIDLLKDTFGDRLISRFGPVNWPPRSCDLTPLDYFLWSYVKSLVYADKPQTLDHLEDNIRRVIANIRPHMLENVIENWTSRLDYIRASRGSPMPEIIFKM
ncbi:DUF4817 domain-containing protein [Trichonephila clavipes]|nr:DUF4817 domain-containing protein [Trichonephila clavipes]